MGYIFSEIREGGNIKKNITKEYKGSQIEKKIFYLVYTYLNCCAMLVQLFIDFLLLRLDNPNNNKSLFLFQNHNKFISIRLLYRILKNAKLIPFFKYNKSLISPSSLFFQVNPRSSPHLGCSAEKTRPIPIIINVYITFFPPTSLSSFLSSEP